MLCNYSESINHSDYLLVLWFRDSKNATAGDTPVSTREVIGVTKSLETITLAESADNGWSLLDNDWRLKLEKKSGKDGHLFELMGNTMVSIYILVPLLSYVPLEGPLHFSQMLCDLCIACSKCQNVSKWLFSKIIMQMYNILSVAFGLS